MPRIVIEEEEEHPRPTAPQTSPPVEQWRLHIPSPNEPVFDEDATQARPSAHRWQASRSGEQWRAEQWGLRLPPPNEQWGLRSPPPNERMGAEDARHPQSDVAQPSPPATPDQWAQRRGTSVNSVQSPTVTRPPSTVPPMWSGFARPAAPFAASLAGDNATTLESFPMRRENQPNYQKLALGYYRLFHDNGPLQSRERIYADDESLAEFAFEHLAPPRSYSSLRNYISARERVHPSRLRLFIPSNSGPTGPSALDQRVRWGEVVPFHRSNDPTWAFRVQVHIEAGEERHDLQHAAGMRHRAGLACGEACEACYTGCTAFARWAHPHLWALAGQPLDEGYLCCFCAFLCCCSCFHECCKKPCGVAANREGTT